MAKLVICNSCGAQFGNDHPKCPYCGTMNYEGAEKEYFEKLEDIREDVEELNTVPMQETKAELKKQGKFIRKVVTIVIVLAAVFGGIIFLQERSYERDNKADFMWKEANYPIMDELYANGEYEELMTFYMQAAEEDKPVYMWEHSEFVRAYDHVACYYDYEAFLDTVVDDEIEVWRYGLYLWTQWKVYGYQFSGDLTEEEKAYFAEAFADAEESLKNDWDYDEVTYQEFLEKASTPYGSTVSFEECDAYIKEWKKTKEKK